MKTGILLTKIEFVVADRLDLEIVIQAYHAVKGGIRTEEFERTVDIISMADIGLMDRTEDLSSFTGASDNDTGA